MNRIERLPCDLCRNKYFKLIFYYDLLDGPLVKCKNCGLVQVNPIRGIYLIKDGQSKVERDETYNAYSKIIKAKLPYDTFIEQKEEKYKAINWNNRLREIQRIMKTGYLLEIGGRGQFLSIARNCGYKVIGVEPLESICNQAKIKYGINILPKTVKEANFNNDSFDIVCMFHVIEHVPSPSELTSEIYRILRKNGLFVIETPRINIWFNILKKKWRQFIPDHYWFFDSITIQKLLNKYNFNIIDIKSIGKSVSLLFLLNRAERLIGKSARILLKALEILGIEKKIIYINQGDIMFLIAKKG